LLGFHQVENAATAYTALMIAQTKGLAVSDGAIQKGFIQVAWPGRFELLQRTPPMVVVDSAHNRDSALKLRLALDDYFPGSPVILLFGASEDKDISGMFAELMPRVSQVVATKSIHPRAIDPEKLVEMARQYDRPAKAVSEIEQALDVALEIADGEAIVLATGSIFVAAAVREVWQARFGEKRLQLSRNNL
jgi:dihydrofolate synthase/folylpolyglutamate synthase